MYSDDMLRLFQPYFEKIKELAKFQVDEARKLNKYPCKIILSGGFGDSRAIQQYLEREVIGPFNAEANGLPVMELFYPGKGRSGRAVAYGAVMRAQDKENGPKRTPLRSIGVLRHIPADDSYYSKEVLKQKPKAATLSGQLYIKDTIEWVIKAVSRLSIPSS